MAQTKRINTGLYEMTYRGRVFHLENMKLATDGESMGWIGLEVKGDDREYCDDAGTKHYLIKRIKIAVDEDAVRIS